MSDEVLIQALKDAHAALTDMLAGLSTESFSSIRFKRDLYEYGYRPGVRVGFETLQEAVNRRDELEHLLSALERGL